MPPSRILPDTCAWIDFLRGKQTPLAATLEQSLLHIEVLTCGVVLFELLQGIKSQREEALVQSALMALPHLEMSRDLWIKSGSLASRLRTSGNILPLSDIIIATLALEHNCAVLTIDRHFESVPGLKILKGLP